jgi:DNA-binding Lrp family transcriptional regulator
MTKPIPAAQLLALEQCFRDGLSWEAAAAATKVSEPTVGRYFRMFKDAGIPRGTPQYCNDDRVTAVNVPHAVLADRDHRAGLAPRSIVAAIAGDPLPGYSALDQR